MKHARLWAPPLLFIGAAAILAAAVPGRADVATGGSYDLTSDARGPGGSPSSAQYEAETAVQFAAGSSESAGTYAYLSGFFDYLNGFYLLSLLPPSPIYVQDGQAYGVASAQGIQAAFSTPVSSASLVGAATAYLVYDHNGNYLNQPVPVALSGYDPSTATVLLVSSAGWQMGATYRLSLGTGAFDLNGDPLVAGSTLTFHAQQDFTQNNVVPSADGSGSGVQIPPGALTGIGFVVVSSDPYNGGGYLAADVAEADAKMLSNDGAQSVPVVTEYVKAFASDQTPLAPPLAVPALFTLNYSAPGADGAIHVPGVSAAIRPASLSLYTLDETASLWESVPTASVNEQADQVESPVSHFSVYAAIATADTDVSQTYAFPVPWRPNGHDPERYGVPYGQSATTPEGTVDGGISFVNLPQQGMLRIYTITGEQIIAVPMTGAEKWIWNGKNSYGSDVVSGTYLWEIDASGNKKMGKLMIIR